MLSRTSVDGVLYGKEVIDFDISSSYRNCWNNIITGSQWKVRPYGTFDMSKVFGIVTDRVRGHSSILEFIDDTVIDIPEGYQLLIVPYSLLQLAKLDLDMFIQNYAGIHVIDNCGEDKNGTD